MPLTTEQEALLAGFDQLLKRQAVGSQRSVWIGPIVHLGTAILSGIVVGLIAMATMRAQMEGFQKQLDEIRRKQIEIGQMIFDHLTGKDGKHQYQGRAKLSGEDKAGGGP